MAAARESTPARTSGSVSRQPGNAAAARATIPAAAAGDVSLATRGTAAALIDAAKASRTSAREKSRIGS